MTRARNPSYMLYVHCTCTKFTYERSKDEVRIDYDIAEDSNKVIIASDSSREIFQEFALGVV